LRKVELTFDYRTNMNNAPHRYFIIYKPHNMASQFISPVKERLLGDLDFDFPAGIHAIGRLDKDSEGLLILTTNKKITRLLFQSKEPHKRVYLVQVRYEVKEETLRKLRTGVNIQISGGGYYTTPPCDVDIIEKPEYVMPADFPISTYQPYTWLRITLTEGKFRQVRKMVESVRHRCVRLIRDSIEDLALAGLQSGQVREIPENEFFEMLKLKE
jgi:23S rRNA pseudouridine2457 synthase